MMKGRGREETPSLTKVPDDLQVQISSGTLFVYATLNVCFDRNQVLKFTGKSPKTPFHLIHE